MNTGRKMLLGVVLMTALAACSSGSDTTPPTTSAPATSETSSAVTTGPAENPPATTASEPSPVPTAQDIMTFPEFAPIGGRPGQAPFLTEILSGVVDPGAQASPGTQQRLVGDLDRRFPGGRLPVEREQPMTPEGVDGPLDRLPVDVESVELAPEDAPAGVLPPLPEGDQPQEHLFRGVAATGLGRLVDAIGSCG
jgi:hypothetical protein